MRIGGEDIMMNVAESMLVDSAGGSVDADRDIVNHIHARTYLPPSSVELLLRRADKWNPNRRKEIQDAHSRCRSCLRSGDPKPARKFSMYKIHLNCKETNLRRCTVLVKRNGHPRR